MLFSDFNLDPILLAAVEKAGYREPTPIQQQAIPPALAGQDVLGCAQTGTGKTAAFSLPLLARLDALAGDHPKLRALVLTPTRELAAQIGESFSTYGKGLDLDHTVIFGGVSERPQIADLRRGVDAVIATPGRLLDLLRQRHVDLSDIAVFVLDEADRMLDMGFLPDVKRIIAALPKQRQTLFFSATMPESIRSLADSLLVNPAYVAVTPVSSTAERIQQFVHRVEKPEKPRLLVDLLRNDPSIQHTLVFTRTKHGANRLVEQLGKSGLTAAAIHGNKSQGARERALGAFRKGELRLLVATDIAARGIDVDGISHVINYELPNVPETYVHRIGRTARAGADGIAISFCDTEELEFLRDIEKLTGKRVTRVGEWGPERAGAPSNGGSQRESRPPRHAPAGRGQGRPQSQGERRGPPPERRTRPSSGATASANGGNGGSRPASANGGNGGGRPASANGGNGGGRPASANGGNGGAPRGPRPPAASGNHANPRSEGVPRPRPPAMPRPR